MRTVHYQDVYSQHVSHTPRTPCGRGGSTSADAGRGRSLCAWERPPRERTVTGPRPLHLSPLSHVKTTALPSRDQDNSGAQTDGSVNGHQEHVPAVRGGLSPGRRRGALAVGQKRPVSTGPFQTFPNKEHIPPAPPGRPGQQAGPARPLAVSAGLPCVPVPVTAAAHRGLTRFPTPSRRHRQHRAWGRSLLL